MKQQDFCNNCGRIGHSFVQCKSPITSSGLIVFRKQDDNIQYLLIRRKDSLGYVELVRGKYSLNDKQYIMNILNEMTNSELNKINSMSFDELWNDLWGDHVGAQYRAEEKRSREKFHTLKEGVTVGEDHYSLDSLLKEANKSWEEAEWGFPKGRRNYQERDLSCALREFEEETGFNRSMIQVLQNIMPYDEIFTGSNYKCYKHRYYVAYMSDNESKHVTEFQPTEVSKMSWFTVESCRKVIRPYNIERLRVLESLDKTLHKYRLCS